MAYTPLYGIQDPNARYQGEDQWAAQQWAAPWIANPNVDYGPAPESGFMPMFDNSGKFIGWQDGNNSFYEIDPTTGDLGNRQSWVPGINTNRGKWGELVAKGLLATMFGAAAGGAAGIFAPDPTSWTGIGLAGSGGGSAAGGVAKGITDATTSAAQFAAADAAQLASQGLSSAQIQQVLIGSGLDPFIAADAAQLAAQGIGEASILQNLTAAHGTNLTGGAGAIMPAPGVHGYTTAPNTTFLPNGTQVPLAGQPGWDPGTGGTSLPGVNSPGTNTPGSPGTSTPGSPNAPNVPGSPGGGNNTTNGSSPVGVLDWLMRMYDSYNKGQRSEKNADEMFKWANKIFGRSGDFENMLMNTYTNPDSYLQGPEGQSLNRIVQNQALRTDARAGNLSNDTNRSVVLQDRMMQGLGNYRTGLSRDAALGRNSSAVALDAVGKALKEETNASQWYTPLTYGSGQSGTPNVGGTVTDIWNQVKNLGGVAQDAWKWFSGQG